MIIFLLAKWETYGKHRRRKRGLSGLKTNRSLSLTIINDYFSGKSSKRIFLNYFFEFRKTFRAKYLVGDINVFYL
jgi:hypothetical protein